MIRESVDLLEKGENLNEFSMEIPGSGGTRKSKLSTSEDIIPFPYEAYDHVQTAWEVLERSCRLYGNRRCWGWRNSKPAYTWITYNEFMVRARDFGSGLVNIGMSPGQSTSIGIYGKNSIEWVVAEYGCFSQSAVIIPIYDTLGPEATTHMIQIADIEIIICGDESKARNILQKGTAIPTLKHIIVMHDLSEELKQQTIGKEVQLHSFKDIEVLGKENPVPIVPPSGSDIYMTCFTSGTTGDPKGAELSNKYFISVAASVLMHWESENIFLTENDAMLSYLPLAHIFEHLTDLVILLVGGSIGFYSGDVNLITEDIKILQPTIFLSVPRLLNKLYDKAQELFHSKSKPNPDIILKLENLDAERDIKPSPLQFDPSLYKPFHHMLGGKIRIVLTGSAPISETVLRFYSQGLGYKVTEVYGQTECGAVAMNVFKESTIGSVGSPLPSCVIKLMGIPELGNFQNKGEICIKGHSLFKGYLKNPQKTAETIDADGWLHTGDIGIFQPNGTLKIVDRIKNIFKLSLGEFIAPEKIEAIYSRSPYVSQVLVYGDSWKDYIVSIVVPEKEAVLLWLKENTKCQTWNEACISPVLKQLILNDMWRLGKDAELCSFEQAKAVYLHPEALTLEGGYLTPTLKTRRMVCREFFKEKIDAMYKAVDSTKTK